MPWIWGLALYLFHGEGLESRENVKTGGILREKVPWTSPYPSPCHFQDSAVLRLGCQPHQSALPSRSSTLTMALSCSKTTDGGLEGRR